METKKSYDVRIWAIETRKRQTMTTYRVRWKVGGKPFGKRFGTSALADSFRGDLLSASRKGEAFDTETGFPVSMIRTNIEAISWYEFACTYVDMKWQLASPKHRAGIAESLVAITCAMLTAKSEEFDNRFIRTALRSWAFNKNRRGRAEQPENVTLALRWVDRNCRFTYQIEQPDVLREVLSALSVLLNGKQASGRTIGLRRTILSNALDYAAERRLISTNPLPALKWRAPKPAGGQVDRQVVTNPGQARALLAAVREMPRNGAKLEAFFGCIYYSALRPEEVMSLRRRNLILPDDSKKFGWLVIDRATPDDRSEWLDPSGQIERQLKHRAVGDHRRVPCPPALVEILKRHLNKYGSDVTGRLFFDDDSERSFAGDYARVWKRAREKVLTAEQLDSPLARRPYDLRHAAVSTWLNNGVAPTQVAEWAGHSVKVLLDTYAKCIDGQQDDALRRIEEALNGAADTDDASRSDETKSEAPETPAPPARPGDVG